MLGLFEATGYDVYIDDASYGLERPVLVVPKIIFPSYLGVSFAKGLYLLFESLLRFITSRKKKSLLSGDVMLLTSSVLLPTIIGLNGQKLIVLVQENIKVNFPNRLLFRLLPNDLTFVCITDSIGDKVRLINPKFEVIVLPNRFDLICKPSTYYKYDLLYMGGEQRIKGYDFVSSFSKSHIASLYRTKYVGFHMPTGQFEGIQEDINDVLAYSKILLIANTHYHFSRPAIEAGLHGVPFVMPDHKFAATGLDNYIYPGVNCVLYKPGCLTDLNNAVSRLLQNFEFFSENAIRISSEFIEMQVKQEKEFLNIIDRIRYEA